MNEQDVLKYALEHGMINMSYVQEQIEMNERRELLEKHPYKIWVGTDGEWRTYLPDKDKGRVLVKRKKEEDVEDRVVEYWRQESENPTISEVFDEWNDRRLPICGDFFVFMGGFSMGERYTRYSTANDVMKEFLIYGAELTDMGFPKLLPVQAHPSDTIDFRSGLSRTFKGHHNTSCNFYIDDEKFLALENNVDKYLNYLKLFQCVLGLDFSIDTQMPLVMQYWNKYRSMALDWYLTLNGIKVIPNVNVIPYEGREWLLDGIPKYSTVCCSTVGKNQSEEAVEEFCLGFHDMCNRLEPSRVIIVGKIPIGLNANIEIVNLKNANQKMRERYQNK